MAVNVSNLSNVSFVESKIAVSSNSLQISIAVIRTGDLSTSASVNVLFNGSTFYYPSADGYDGIKVGLSWNAGEGGTKTVVTPLIPSLDKLVYLDAELVDFLRVNPGEQVNAYVAIYQQGITPSWIPSAPGNYYQEIQVSQSGIKVNVVPVSHGNLNETFIGATDTEDGSFGIVPQPVAGDEKKFLTGGAIFEELPVFQGATDISDGVAGILPLPGIGNDSLFFCSNGEWLPIPDADSNIDFSGQHGLEVTPNYDSKTVTFSLPAGSEDGQALLWDMEVESYVPGNIPGGSSYTGATLTKAGKAGIVSAPPAGEGNRYAAADGTWRTENTIDGQDGGGDGKVVRITTYDQTWMNASNTDTVDQLHRSAIRANASKY